MVSDAPGQQRALTTMAAVPIERAVTVPFPVTEAIAGARDCHERLAPETTEPLEVRAVALKTRDCPIALNWWVCASATTEATCGLAPDAGAVVAVTKFEI
jgi:hypothetical protein